MNKTQILIVVMLLFMVILIIINLKNIKEDLFSRRYYDNPIKESNDTGLKELEQNINISFNFDNTKEKSIKCETELKIVRDCWNGIADCNYNICYRCKDLNKSIMENIIPKGDWVCPV